MTLDLHEIRAKWDRLYIELFKTLFCLMMSIFMHFS